MSGPHDACSSGEASDNTSEGADLCRQQATPDSPVPQTVDEVGAADGFVEQEEANGVPLTEASETDTHSDDGAAWLLPSTVEVPPDEDASPSPGGPTIMSPQLLPVAQTDQRLPVESTGPTEAAEVIESTTPSITETPTPASCEQVDQIAPPLEPIMEAPASPASSEQTQEQEPATRDTAVVLEKAVSDTLPTEAGDDRADWLSKSFEESGVANKERDDVDAPGAIGRNTEPKDRPGAQEALDVTPTTIELSARYDREANLPSPKRTEITPGIQEASDGFAAKRREASSENPRMTLTEVSEHYGVEITAQKRVTLEGLRANARESAQGSQLYHYTDSGLKVQLWHKGAHARLDFTPGGEYQAPDDRTRRNEFALTFIQAMQDYCLLVEAGYLERPGYLGNTTNHTMGSYLERHYGFQQSPSTWNDELVQVEGAYATLLEHAFSEQTQAAKTRLTERLNGS